MRMKHRWIVIAAATATLVLGACRPADSGADESNAAPSTTNVTEPSATPTPYEIDEY